MSQSLHAALIFSFLAGSAISASFAQEPEATETTETTETTATAIEARLIEEITVIGQKSLARLRLRIIEKENGIYNFFNAQNSSDRLDIICNKRRPTGTNILQRQCEPRFLKALRVEKTRDASMGFGVGFNQYDLVGLSHQDFEKLENEMLALMAANKAFADSLADLVDLTENLAAHRQAIFGDP